jgi:AcrR family transcriptional regulator
MALSDTKDRLINTAMQMFWQKGYASTSVADILQAAGVNSGSLYHFFPGKQDLLLAVLARYREGIGPMLLEPAWRGESDPIEKIFALLARYRQAIVQTDTTYGCPIGGLALEIHEPDPPVREAIAANFAAWTDAVEECLDAAGDRLPSGLDRKELAGFILTVMEGGVMQSRTHRDVAYFDGSVRQLRRYVDQLQREAAAERPFAIKRARPKSSPRSVGRKGAM